MNYTVIESPSTWKDSMAARQQLEAKGEGHVLVQRVQEIDDTCPMEHLYSAVVALVEITGVSPFNLELKVTSTGESKSLYRVIEGAREWLDRKEVRQ